MKTFLCFLLFSSLLGSNLSAAEAPALPRTPSPKGAAVYFISPANGDSIRGPVTIRFGLKGMGVAPAGIDLPDTGHHHLLVNSEALPDLNLPMPMSESLLHFGKGQTEVELNLPKGEYRLQLVFGDKLHIPHDPPLISEPIAIMVE